MLRLENVKKHYGEFSLECSLEVQAGCVTGLIGKNGEAKVRHLKPFLG